MMFRTYLNRPPQVLCLAVTCHDTDVLPSQAMSCQQKMSVTSLSGRSSPCVTNRLLTTCRFAVKPNYGACFTNNAKQSLTHSTADDTEKYARLI